MKFFTRFKKKKGLKEKKKKELTKEKKKIEKIPKKKIVSEKGKRKPKEEKKISSFPSKILVMPHISEKATLLSDKGKYIFKVFQKANRTEVKKAVEELYNVKVQKVNIQNIKRKKRRLGEIEGFKPGYKKAIVTLKEGDKIDILPR